MNNSTRSRPFYCYSRTLLSSNDCAFVYLQNDRCSSACAFIVVPFPFSLWQFAFECVHRNRSVNNSRAAYVCSTQRQIFIKFLPNFYRSLFCNGAIFLAFLYYRYFSLSLTSIGLYATYQVIRILSSDKR